MDASSRPRLRLFRRSPSPRMPDGGAEATPQPAPSSTRSLLSSIHDEEDELPTPRIHPKPIASLNLDPTPGSTTGATPIPAETPAARLRALLAREPRSPRNTTPVPPPAPVSEADSAAEPAHFGSSTSSVTRETLKDIFTRALREPGDTPRKGRLRRNSFDGSSMEITPVVARDRGQRGAARRSLSDEEAEKPKYNRKPDPSFRLSTAVTFDSLRARLVSSQSQLMDQSLPEPSDDPSASTSNSQPHHRVPTSPQIGSTHTAPLASTSTPYPSFQMSSRLALQSNLLEQDSEMQRAIGEVLNSENEASTSAPNAAQSTAVSSDLHPSSSISRSKDGSKPRPRRTSYEFDSLTTSSLMNAGTDRVHRSQGREYNNQYERERDRPRLPSSSSTPDMHRRHSLDFRSAFHTKSLSHESATSQSSAARPVHKHLQRRDSLASLRSLDDDYSPSSIGSQADHRERVLELEQEKNHEREREWNKRQPPSRPSSSLSTSSNQSFSHTHSHPPRSPSAATHLAPTHSSLQRSSSRTSLRSDSPASLASSRDSLKERKQEEKKEITHERERNWNSARPHWSISKSPSPHVKIRNKDNNSLRATSSLIHFGDSNGGRDASSVSTKQQTALPKVDYSSATSPALLHKSGGRSPAVSGIDKSAIGTIHAVRSNGLSPSPGAASKFGWNFARSPLPPLELDDPTDHRTSISSPTPDSNSQPSSRTSEAVMSSQIPVRSKVKSFSNVVRATSDMSLTHVAGDESSLQRDYQNGLTEIVEPRSHGEFLATRSSWSREDMVPDSINELPPQSTTPKSNPPNRIPEEIETDTETEVLTSPSPRGSPRLEPPISASNVVSLQKTNNPPYPQTSNPSLEEPSVSATPPDTPSPVDGMFPTSETSPSFALITPPRQTSFGSTTFDFRTPSPPHDLPDLPGPPLSSDDDALGGTPLKDRHVGHGSSNTLTKTPKPPGAWVATPLPPKSAHGSSSPMTLFPLESTPPAFTSTPLPRAISYHPTPTASKTDDPDEDEPLTPVGTLSRAKSLPLRTPAPPGAWTATLSQSALLGNGADQSQYASGSLGRRKGLLKVRFDVTESETSTTEGHLNSPTSAIKLANPDLSLPRPTADCGTDDTEVDISEAPQLTPISTAPLRSATPEQPTTPISRENGPSPRSLRKSPAVRLVDAFGRERVGAEGTTELSTDLPNGYADAERKTTSSPPTSRRSLVRIVDAMGREVDAATKIPDASEGKANGSLEADVSVVSDDIPVGHAEALARMRKTLRDLVEGLSDTDRSEDLELDSGHVEQLEEVSRAARLARNQLVHNLHLETAKHHDLHRGRKFPAWTRGLLPGKSWNTTIIYCGIVIQLFFFLAMWRYAHLEAHRLFYTTYYDPLYPEFTPIQESSCIGDSLSIFSRSWTMLDSYETIRREGWWSVRIEILRVMKHIGDQAWECWGEHPHFEKPT